MKKKFDVNYYNGKKEWTHKYTETWEFEENIHCPCCGKKSVWSSDGYDYYLDNEHICIECNTSFYLPSFNDIGKDIQGLQRLENLKSEK